MIQEMRSNGRRRMISLDSHQTEVFFFYSKKENKLYCQEGLGQDELDSNQPTAKILSSIIEPINNIVVQDGNLLVISEEGTHIQS